MSTPKELIEKATKGEIEVEELKTKIEELTDDERIEFSNLAKQKSEETLSEFSGLTKEKQRRLKQLEELGQGAGEEGKNNPEPAQQPGPMDQFRQEQVLKAERRLKEQYDLSDEEVAKIKEEFERIDSGKVDADLIYEDFVGAYAMVNKEALLSAQQKAKQMQQNAAQATTSAAGSTSANPDQESTEKQYSEEAKSLAKSAGISEEAAEKQLQQGMRRTY